MSNLKEHKLQERITEEIQRWWCDIGCNDCAEEVAKSILIIIKQAGYYPLQADSEGLAKNPYKGDAVYVRKNNGCFTTLFDAFEQGSIAQKALCDKEKEEAVKKVKLHLYKIRDFLCPEIKTKKYAIDSINELLEELE